MVSPTVIFKNTINDISIERGCTSGTIKGYDLKRFYSEFSLRSDINNIFKKHNLVFASNSNIGETSSRPLATVSDSNEYERIMNYLINRQDRKACKDIKEIAKSNSNGWVQKSRAFCFLIDGKSHEAEFIIGLLKSRNLIEKPFSILFDVMLGKSEGREFNWSMSTSYPELLAVFADILKIPIQKRHVRLIDKKFYKATLSLTYLTPEAREFITSYKNKNLKIVEYPQLSNEVLCDRATLKGNWFNGINHKGYIKEAKRRGLDCGVVNNETTIASNQTKIPANRPLASVSDSTVCYNATWTTSNGKKVWNARNDNFVGEANYRGLDCGISNRNKIIASNNVSRSNVSSWSNAHLCSMATSGSGNSWTNETYLNFAVVEAKRRSLDCGVKDNNRNVIASKPKAKTYTQPESTISSAELEVERKKRKELERKLAELETKQKQEQKTINSDNQEPTINVFAKQDGSNAIISGRVTDNIEIAEVLVDGQVQKLKSNGTFETELYVPRSGLNVEIVAYDKKGNKALETLKLERGGVAQASGPIFNRLNPSVKRVKSNPNALALIIGISNYSKTKANALYADKDAQQFYDYATMKLGIPSSNIKELVNEKADLGEILINVKEWLRRSAKPNKSDIYVFFAGHGLASQDGTKMYLLPYDGRPQLLENTALLRDELFKDVKQANPRSVTVFLDTCYSGITRGTDMLIASRPIAIRVLEQSIPNNFTVFSAAAGDQTSKPLEEAKHGMFSYFLMKGMEGDADTNNDNKITARELHAYVEQNVVQQSSGSQIPELQGDKDKVLVQFN